MGTQLKCTINKRPRLHPLQVEYIVEHIFGFLSLPDIKSCRLVNNFWKDVGSRIMRGKSQVVFDSNAQSITNNLSGLEHYFKNYQPENVPFNSVVFRGTIPLLLFISFMESAKYYLKEVEVTPGLISLASKRKFCMIALIGPDVKRVSVTSTYYYGVTTLCADLIPFLQELHLDGSQIILRRSKCKLSLTKLFLGRKNRYFRNGEEMNKFEISDYFDLRKTVFLQLEGEKIILDFEKCTNGNVKAEILFRSVIILNWDKCDWKTQTITLVDMPLPEKNTMAFEEMKICEI